jgi:hypothetical protein
LLATSSLTLQPATKRPSIGEEVAGSADRTSGQHEVAQPSFHNEVEAVALALDPPDEGGVVLTDELFGMRLERDARRTLGRASD